MFDNVRRSKCSPPGSLSCKLRSLCEGLRAAAGQGEVGAVLARVSATAAAHWLPGLRAGAGRRLGRAGRGRDCGALYPCTRRPSHYQHPSRVASYV